MLTSLWKKSTAPVFGEIGAIPLNELQRRRHYPESRYISVQGMNVHYRDVGEGPVLICLHGIFASLHTWDAWTQTLSKHFRVISIDNPNFGLTGAHPEGLRKHLYSDFLNDFTNAMGIDRCYMAGNSLGGWMTFEFAARFPEKVEKLILLDSAGFFFIPPPILISMAMPFGSWFASRFKMPRSVLKAVIKTTYGDPSRLSDEMVDVYHDMLLREGNRDAAGRVMRFIRNTVGFDHSYLKQIKQPTLIMWGRKDGWIPVSHVEKFNAAVPHAEVCIYEDCGHMPMEEIPQRSAADALRFLQS